MPTVPASHIASAPIYWEDEALACAGGSIRWCGHDVPPVTLGAMMLLEFLDSPTVTDFANCGAVDFARAVVVLRERDAAMPAVLDWCAHGKPADFGANTLDDLAQALLAKADIDTVEDDHVRLYRWIAVAFAGYSMIPSRGGSSGTWLFGGPTLGTTVAVLGPALGVAWHDVIWHVPLALCGFATAAVAQQNGCDHVARPKDPEDVKRQLEAAKQRETDGELHPW